MLRDRVAYRIVARLLASRPASDRTCAVVSAPYGVTDALVELARVPREEGGRVVLERFAALELGGRAREVERELTLATQEAARGAGDRLLAFGEWASAVVLREQLGRLGVDAPIVELGDQPGDSSYGPAIIPGFYVRDRNGRIRCLPRGGGDISAVRVGVEVGAREVRFWKEAGGFVRNGITLPHVESADLLTWLGEEIRPIHPEAVRVARRHRLPLVLEDPYRRRPSTVVRHGGSGRSALGRVPRDEGPIVAPSEPREMATWPDARFR